MKDGRVGRRRGFALDPDAETFAEIGQGLVRARPRRVSRGRPWMRWGDSNRPAAPRCHGPLSQTLQLPEATGIMALFVKTLVAQGSDNGRGIL